MENRLKELRAMRGWSQAHLADLVEVSRQTVNALEKGRYDPSLPLAFRLARIFDTPIEDLFKPSAADLGLADANGADANGAATSTTATTSTSTKS